MTISTEINSFKNQIRQSRNSFGEFTEQCNKPLLRIENGRIQQTCCNKQDCSQFGPSSGQNPQILGFSSKSETTREKINISPEFEKILEFRFKNK